MIWHNGLFDQGFVDQWFLGQTGTQAVSHPGISNVETAGHAFDNHESDMFYNEGAANAAWAKTMAFLATHLPA